MAPEDDSTLQGRGVVAICCLFFIFDNILEIDFLLLLIFNGVNGSEIFLDGITPLLDINSLTALVRALRDFFTSSPVDIN